MADKVISSVLEIYNKIADWFDEHRSRELFEKPYLDLAISLIKPASKILDLGCGMGEPIAAYLISKGFDVTGVDGSEKQIALAKARVPLMKSFVADMRNIEFFEKYSCIIAWHSFFHLSQNDQRAMFIVFEKHIASNGILIFTSGVEAGEVWSDNGGEQLYHASLSTFEYTKLLTDHHFQVISHNIEDENCGGATVWVAQYSGSAK